jgi:hypothetical protein
MNHSFGFPFPGSVSSIRTAAGASAIRTFVLVSEKEELEFMEQRLLQAPTGHTTRIAG